MEGITVNQGENLPVMVSLNHASAIKGNLTDGFFTATSYIGAFDGATDWTTGWAVWGK